MSDNLLDDNQETGISQSIKNNMRETAPWMKFLGILFMIIGGLYTIFGILAVFAAPLAGLFTLGICGLYIYLGYLLFKSGSDYSAYLATNSTYSLEAAFANQKMLWKITGILTIVGIVLGIAAFVFGATLGSQMSSFRSF